MLLRIHKRRDTRSSGAKRGSNLRKKGRGAQSVPPPFFAADLAYHQREVLYIITEGAYHHAKRVSSSVMIYNGYAIDFWWEEGYS